MISPLTAILIFAAVIIFGSLSARLGYMLGWNDAIDRTKKHQTYSKEEKD